MLTVLIFVLLGMATVHFIYEKIILPSIRLHYRNKLFEVRDKVRDELINNAEQKSVESAKLVHDALNNAINRLHLMTFQNQVKARTRLYKDPSLRHKVQIKVNLINSSENQAVISSLKESIKILNKVLIFNSFMLFLYALPIFLIVTLIAKIVSSVASRIKQFLSGCRRLEEAVMVLPDRLMKKLIDSEYDCDSYVRV
ncbi:TPA: hypothetical protein SMN72_001411 [Proteus mirabilis]|uniref:hypothetical protein n=1 Tax=Proteus mirabilis TaxID=584 RepID=UPI00111B1538|nr:hypothetical protein [Proteus mirabilis]ELA9706235.1 hypothetical protein [Proteus mirabilis]MBG5993276.1 hypothetical protein [Proteus mirabilis]HEJ9809355.1 hypothetical protein [Proteus mirabilis]HEK0517008.1 hypothetical protein [Proteus mirabilis]HEK2101406.1 hypothetical protein [Proteus mirabilis]